MNVLLTGGAGYIGSHLAVSLFQAGHIPIIIDNFCNASLTIGLRLNQIVGSEIKIIKGDVRDTALVESTLASNNIDAVVHLAGFKSVAQSTVEPLPYYANNVGGALSLLQAMQRTGVRKFVFSSSATVYGEPQRLPIAEDHPRSAVSPYGQSKLICENMLSDLASSGDGWQVSILRYFNPVGAHESGLIGEDPQGVPSNLMPLVALVARGERAHLDIFGIDYPTDDGTAVRDYIHVSDLAEGHVAALAALGDADPFQTYNLGTGNGTSVAELIAAFEKATGARVPFQAAPRRAGDVPILFASSGKAQRRLGWNTKRDLNKMCVDSWRFASN